MYSFAISDKLWLQVILVTVVVADIKGYKNPWHLILAKCFSCQEQYFLPSKNQIGRVSRNCHTSAIFTPNGKENAQRMAVK